MAKLKNYKDLSLDELSVELKEKKSALFNMRFQRALQQLDHPISIRNARREIARINTRITELKKLDEKNV